MQKNIHPEIFDVNVRCACGAMIETRSTSDSIRPTICSSCHPFFTGDQKFVDSAGRIEKFKKKYGKNA